MDALWPAVVVLDRGWRRFVGLVAEGAAAVERARPQTPAAANPAPRAPVVQRSTEPSRRFRAAGYRPRLAGSDDGATGTGSLPARTDAEAVAPSAAPAAPAAPAATIVAAATGPAEEPASAGSAVGRAPADAPVAEGDARGAAALAAHLDERRAQAAGLRALLLARQRRYAEAETAFAQAAGLDPGLDLAGLDGFWDLERGAHQAAVRAYEAVGRHRDAMAMRATLDGRYRPRLVRTA